MSLMTEIMPKVQGYLDGTDWSDVPVMKGRKFTVAPLAQGEYNLNYRITAQSLQLVFRINIGTQINREDQIVYEYKALSLLKASGFTPIPYYVDDSRRFFDQGILIMEFIPGEPLDYRYDLALASRLFAGVHSVQVNDDDNHLIREDQPLSLIFEECAGLLETYFNSEFAQGDIRTYLREVITWANENRSAERFYQEDPWHCIVNTEVNSGNFIVDRTRDCVHLVDWEMPRWGDPSQDLSHFCSPLTTLWKTDFCMTPKEKRDFIKTYQNKITDGHLKATLEDRIRLRDPYVYLRGISWSAMGWVAYQTHFGGMKNPDTWATLQRYMDLTFIRSLFDPFLSGP